MYNLRKPLLILTSLILITVSACTSQSTPAAPTPTAGLQALPQDLPTATALPTSTPLPTKKPFITPTPLFVATATQVAALYTAVPGTAEPIGTREILLYEDTGNIGGWIKETLNKMDLPYSYAAGSGALLKFLQSDTHWDLIILAAEFEASVQGDLWDLINTKVIEEDTALIAELWFIDLISAGKIKPFLDTCGVELSDRYNLRRAVPVHLLDRAHPIFNTPNYGFPAVIDPAPYFDDQAVDYLRLLPDSPAKILAGGVEGDTLDNGLIVSCMDRRVILQTFLNHDFGEGTVKALWENYIVYVLQQSPK